jgi:tyrosine-protein kinase Etk/Wzc
LKMLHTNVKVIQNDYGNIEVSVIDSSPSLAAQMANFMIFELDTITHYLAKESARNSRIFFEDRLDVIKRDLDSASREFTRFQSENSYIDLEQQVKSSIEALAQFEAQKMALDLEVAQLQSQFGSSNQRIAELEKQKSVIGKKIKGYMSTGGGNLIISLKDAPEKAVQYGYLLRNVKIQESLYEFVLQMFEQAKFSEANNVPAMQVLEYAKDPQKKAHPKRSAVCLFFFFAGFAITSTYILLEKWWGIQAQDQTVVYLKIKRILALVLLQKRPA